MSVDEEMKMYEKAAGAFLSRASALNLLDLTENAHGIRL
jgi:hypothetical protein